MTKYEAKIEFEFPAEVDRTEAQTAQLDRIGQLLEFVLGQILLESMGSASSVVAALLEKKLHGPHYEDRSASVK